jgi:hypothetical protein
LLKYKNKKIKLHSILTFKMSDKALLTDNGNKGCINRNVNAVHNMKNIVVDAT